MSTKKQDIGTGIAAGMGIGMLLIGGMFLVAKYAPLPDVQLVVAQEELLAPSTDEPAPPSPARFVVENITSPQEATSTPAAIPFLRQPSPIPPTATEITEILVLRGPLNGEEQAQLHAASLRFVAIEFSKVKAVGERVNGIGYGHPSNICGPLSIAILQEAHILSKTVVPYSFWLLNPDDKESAAHLAETFPNERFQSWRDKRSLDKIDWRDFPLMPGDFLYLYSGSRGNFEHMLVVTRVDETGRAYSVTNHNTEELGFIITEELLYDPNSPGDGLFYEWTAREKAVLGSTGFEGFQLWRLKEN